MTNTILKEGISETLDILEHMEQAYIDTINKDFLNFLHENKSENYTSNLDHSLEISEMNLKKETKNLLLIIYLLYWCSEEERAEYIELLKENNKKYQKEVNINFNPETLFSNKNTSANTDELLPVEIKQKSILEKFIDFIKKQHLKCGRDNKTEEERLL